MKPAAKILVLLALGAWVYGPCLHGGWLWDDGLEVAHNPALPAAGGWWQAWVHPVGMDYFPLKTSLQWLEWRLWGAQPLGYHLVNLGLHLANALLVWRLLHRLAIPGAYLAALLFTVHPLAVESVAWIAEFKNTASLVFLLGAALAYVRFDQRGDRVAYGGSLLAFVAALACKTSVVMFPFVLLLFAWWRAGQVTRRDLVRTAPFFAAALALGLATLHFQATRATGEGGVLPPFGARLLAAGGSLLAYGRQSLLPTGLAPIYPAASPLMDVVGWLAVGGVLAVCLGYRSGWGRPVLLGFGWFLLNLVPVLGILPMSYLRIAPRADHFAYLPLVGIVGLAAALGTAAFRSAMMPGGAGPGRPRVAVASGVAVVAACALAAHRYAGVFRSEDTLWSAAVAQDPQSWLAHNNLGQVRQQAGAYPAALDEYTTAVRLQPDSAEAHANRGTTLAALQRGPEAQAEYREALRLDPAFAGAHFDLGLSLFNSRQYPAAAQEFQAALRFNPQHAGAHNMLGLTLAKLGQGAAGRAEFEAALRLEPQNAGALINLGNQDFRDGRYEAALAEWHQVPQPSAGLRANIAQALRRLGRADAVERAAGGGRP